MSENWNKRNNEEVRTIIEQIKATKPTVAIIEGSTVFFGAKNEQEEIGLCAWDTMVALCLILDIQIEYA